MEVQISHAMTDDMTDFREFYEKLLEDYWYSVGCVSELSHTDGKGGIARDFFRGKAAALAGRPLPSPDMLHYTLAPSQLEPVGNSTTKVAQWSEKLPTVERMTKRTVRFLAFVKGMLHGEQIRDQKGLVSRDYN